MHSPIEPHVIQDWLLKWTLSSLPRHKIFLKSAAICIFLGSKHFIKKYIPKSSKICSLLRANLSLVQYIFHGGYWWLFGAGAGCLIFWDSVFCTLLYLLWDSSNDSACFSCSLKVAYICLTWSMEADVRLLVGAEGRETVTISFMFNLPTCITFIVLKFIHVQEY